MSTTDVSALRPSIQWSFKFTSSTLMQTLQLGIATTLILEYSFFLSQQSNWHESAKTLKLAAAEYNASGTPAAVLKAVKDVLSQDDGDDEKLCKMIIDIILRNRLSKE
ncbi:hypothetical protein K503DRAFT_770173 [Rhizopogon vinicolor AM-OR11-026]|uniref:Uncharacterized protein n=1 Tax=Rhizopogon vinicolor AM-OR11-026 TaxID=1314800 RepID=A0A1B7N1J4_9AGAM|nr:hypothetical protein K503DRAFT_770173 [Rhizopogon vinicolor AM-OR11-026]